MFCVEHFNHFGHAGIISLVEIYSCLVIDAMSGGIC